MEFLGIGPSELVFIILIAIIILGPKDMQKAGRTIGRWLNQLVRSEGWKMFQRTSHEIRNLPTSLMREANMEMMEAEKELRRTLDPRVTPNRDPSIGTTGELPPLDKAENNAPDESATDKADQPDVPGGDDANA